jgi:hypothetical protein
LDPEIPKKKGKCFVKKGLQISSLRGPLALVVVIHVMDYMLLLGCISLSRGFISTLISLYILV